jgi:nucleotide-binding universal stress UspA family protein
MWDYLRLNSFIHGKNQKLIIKPKTMKTKELKKVLIALDYDPTAKEVAEQGYLLAKTMKADVIFLHVIAEETYYAALEYSPIVGFLGFEDEDVMELTTKDGLKTATKRFLDKMKYFIGDDRIETVVEEGKFADIILETAKKMHANVIVMGSHSRGWVEELLMGSVTEKVLKHTNIPLYIVPVKKHTV